MNPSKPTLDSLFAEAQAAAGKPAKTPVAPRRVGTLERYALPEYWLRGRCVALIHAETHTFLGFFQEYRHRTEAGARKLLLAEGLLPVTHTEYVSGDAWLGFRREAITSAEPWTSTRDLMLPQLLLHHFGVSADLPEVRVYFRFGGIARVELLAHTTFHSPDARIALTLPRGTNLLEVMDLQAKIDLRKELQS